MTRRCLISGYSYGLLPVKLFCLLMTLFCVSAGAQEIRINGGFLSDSLMVGEQTAFYLSAHYPEDTNILFPDSTADFAPFEYQRKEYFPTRTDNGISRDSVVFYLTTFEVDRVQYLGLPVYAVQPQDCTVFRSDSDSVLLTQMVASVPDSLTADKLPLKMNTAYQKVPHQFNFWILIIVIAVLVIILVVTWIFFGKKIGRYFRARKLQKDHSQFLQAYNSVLHDLKSAFSSMNTESAIALWKRYMEQLDAKPYTKLTTRETLSLVKDEGLGKNLSAVDQAIYGHNTSVIESLENLKNFAEGQFSKKLEELKHG